MSARIRHEPCALAALALLLLGAPATWAASEGWRADVPCGRVLDAPREASRPGCAAAACADVPGGTNVCACKEAATGDLHLAVVRGGAEVQAWPVEPMLGEVAAFRVALADLDGDAHDELIVSVLDAVSNGMAVQSWTICVLDGRDPSRARACVPANDVPFLSMPTRPARGAQRACRLLAARWRWGNEPGRGDGLYLVGRWLVSRDGVLTSDPRRPAIARRYLYRFAAERGDALDHGRMAPIRWWQDATTRVLRCPGDPLCREEKEP